LFPNAQAPAVLPADQGQGAWSQVCQYMQNKDKAWTQMVPIAQISVMKKMFQHSRPTPVPKVGDVLV